MNAPTDAELESPLERKFFQIRRETRPPYILACLVLWSILSFLLISRFVVSSVEIDGVSMEDTLHDHQRYLVNRLIYQLRDPLRGEMAVIQDHLDDGYVIKRIVGLPGELIEFKGGKILIDGRELPENYLPPETETWPMKASLRSHKIPPRHYFVLGDNRANSTDSRMYGSLERGSFYGLVRP